jgi:hypothetical protein
MMSRLEIISDSSGTPASYKFLGAGQIVADADAGVKRSDRDSPAPGRPTISPPTPATASPLCTRALTRIPA